MKMIIFLGLFFLIPSSLYAGSLTIDFPDSERARIVSGITQDGGACASGESPNLCAKRLVVENIKQRVKYWDKVKSERAAMAAIDPISEPTVN